MRRDRSQGRVRVRVRLHSSAVFDAAMTGQPRHCSALQRIGMATLVPEALMLGKLASMRCTLKRRVAAQPAINHFDMKCARCPQDPAHPECALRPGHDLHLQLQHPHCRAHSEAQMH